MATYGPGIDQSQHAKSVSHIIISTIQKKKEKKCSIANHTVCNGAIPIHVSLLE